MRTCDVCGNEIATRATRCPFCESPQAPARAGGAARRSPGGAVARINLKDGMPTVAEALRHLDLQLAAHRTRGTRVLVVVHGYGSSGAGGAIRSAARRQLRALRERGQVRTVIEGEAYSEFDEASRALRTAFPQLESSFRSDRANPGITLVAL